MVPLEISTYEAILTVRVAYIFIYIYMIFVYIYIYPVKSVVDYTEL